MTPTETATILRQYNVWRRGNLEGMPQPDPREIGKAIDAAIERLELAEKERDALLAKIAEMEKQEPVAWVRKLGLDLPSVGCVTDLKYRPSDIPESSYIPLYLTPGAKGE